MLRTQPIADVPLPCCPICSRFEVALAEHRDALHKAERTRWAVQELSTLVNRQHACVIRYCLTCGLPIPRPTSRGRPPTHCPAHARRPRTLTP